MKSPAHRLIAGIHPVREALRSRQALDRIVIAKGAGGPRVQELIELAKVSRVPVRFEPKESLDRLAKGVSHQNAIAFGATHAAVELVDVVAGSNLLLILDGVEDPQNLGAIIRTAHAAGVDAVVVPERRSAPLTETVNRAAAGALEHLRVARVTNVAQALEKLKADGFWVYGLDERGTEEYDQVDLAAPSAIVLGGEGKGLHQNVKAHCDVLVRIPMAGAVSSLNVSVAAGVMLFEWRRKRTARTSSQKSASP